MHACIHTFISDILTGWNCSEIYMKNIHTYARAQTSIHAQIHAYLRTYAITCLYECIRMHAHVHTRIDTNMCIYGLHTHTHIYIYIYIYISKDAYIYTRIQTNSHTAMSWCPCSRVCWGWCFLPICMLLHAQKSVFSYESSNKAKEIGTCAAASNLSTNCIRASV